jgi:hypothetical protein
MPRPHRILRLHRAANVASIWTAGVAFLAISGAELATWCIWVTGTSVMVTVLDLIIGHDVVDAPNCRGPYDPNRPCGHVEARLSRIPD